MLDTTQRLEALKRLKPSWFEARGHLGRFASLAAQASGQAVALVIWVERRTWQVSACFGSKLSAAPRQLPIDMQVVLPDQPFWGDFYHLAALNKLLAQEWQPFIARSLLSVPLYAAGVQLGCLMVLDETPTATAKLAQQEQLLTAIAGALGEDFTLRSQLQNNTGINPLLLASAAEQSMDGIVITDTDIDAPGPRILYANPAFCAMTGYNLEELLGQSPRILQGSATDRQVLLALRDALEVGEAFEGQTVNYRKNGLPYPVRWRISPITDPTGRVTHFCASQRDLSGEWRLQQMLAEIGFIVAASQQETANALDGAIGSTISSSPTGLINPAQQFDERFSALSGNLSKLEGQLRSVQQQLSVNSSLHGRLEEMDGALGLLQMLSLMRPSGILSIGSMRLHFVTGRIVHVEHSHLLGRAAILAILAEESGEFSLDTTAIPINGQLNLDPVALAIESAKQRDESQNGRQTA
jgi:PAS domain S-box-containing protein